MKIFFDTEFTGLHKDTTLISIGLVDENGRTFYAEFTDYDASQCDDWIKENVLAHLKFNSQNQPYDHIYKDNIEIRSTKTTIKQFLTQWLSKYDEVELVSDVCHYDMVLFIDIFGSAFDIPSNICPVCHDVNQDIATHYQISEMEAFDKWREGILDEYDKHINGDKHNSLYDALVIKEIYNICTKKLK